MDSHLPGKAQSKWLRCLEDRRSGRSTPYASVCLRCCGRLSSGCGRVEHAFRSGCVVPTGKYEKNIKPLLVNLELLENVIDCSQYEIESWSIVDAINALDVNMDGIIVTFRIKTL